MRMTDREIAAYEKQAPWRKKTNVAATKIGLSTRFRFALGLAVMRFGWWVLPSAKRFEPKAPRP